MQPTRLKLTNFLSYRDAEISFDGLDAVALTGENGSGKSSLLDAITFALFGEGTRGGARQMDAYVTTGADECRVELEFLLSGQTYRIVRHRSIARNKSLLELFIKDGDDWRALSGKNISDTDAQIAGLLRMDYRTFTASAFVLQGKADSLTADMTDQERKEVLASILGLDLWDRVLERTREQSRGLKADMQALTAQAQRMEGDATLTGDIEQALASNREAVTETQQRIDTTAAQVAELEAAARNQPALQKQIADVRQQTATREQEKAALDRERSQAQAVQAGAQQLLRMGPEINSAVAHEAKLAPQVDALNKQAAEYDRISRELETVTGNRHAWEQGKTSTLVRLTATIEAHQKQAATLQRVPCDGGTQDACPLLASARKAAEELIALNAEFQRVGAETNPHGPKCIELGNARAAQNYDPRELERLRRELDQVRITARRLPELQAAVARSLEAGERITSIDDRAVGILEEIDRLTTARKQLEIELAEVSVNTAALGQLTNQLRMDREQMSRLQAEIGRLEARLETARKATEELATIRDKAAALAEQQMTLDVLEQACSKRGGVPALIVENAVPEIERLANDVLSRVSGGRLAVRLDTQVEGKSTGTMQEVLRITVLDGGVERPYRNYSGAERFVVDISLRVALSKFLSHRAGAEIRTLVIDEGFGSLDAAGRQRIVEALDIIRKDFALCLIITHLEELKDSMPHRITVTKGVSGSEVSVA